MESKHKDKVQAQIEMTKAYYEKYKRGEEKLLQQKV